MKIATRDQIREIDRQTIEEYGVPGLILMENAGSATARVVLDEFPDARSAAIFAAAGNNAGDGFVIARHLINAGLNIAVYLTAPADKLRGDALTNYKAMVHTGAYIVKLSEDFSNYEEADLVIDALFGTGLTRPIEGRYAKTINFINSLPVPKLAVDLPSGLDADTGRPLGMAIKADVTVTFIVPKIGLAVHPGIEYAGKTYVADITTPKALEDEIRCELTTAKTVKGLLPTRESDTHKGTFGHLLILAGSPGKTGAAILTARGAGRAGAGLVTVGVPKSLNAVFETSLQEAMSEPLPDTPRGCLGSTAADIVLGGLMERKTALVIGPGISTTEETKSFLFEVLLNSPLPVLIDADALTNISEQPDILKKMRAPCVITPHPGEMSRLTDKSIKEIQADRIGIARDFAAMYNVYVVLKGARTVIADPGGRVFINPTGNSGMATGGTGDVLSGVIGGFLAQAMKPLDAAVLGVYAHGLAGDMCAEQLGMTGILAGDLASMMPRSLKRIIDGVVEDDYFIRTR